MFQFKLNEDFSLRPKLNRTLHFFEEEKKGLGPSKPKKGCVRSNNKKNYLPISAYLGVQYNHWYEETYQKWRARSLPHAEKTHNTFKDLHTRPVELRDKDRGTECTFPLFSSRKQRSHLICSVHSLISHQSS